MHEFVAKNEYQNKRKFLKYNFWNTFGTDILNIIVKGYLFGPKISLAAKMKMVLKLLVPKLV